jgi:hypothetical protein
MSAALLAAESGLVWLIFWRFCTVITRSQRLVRWMLIGSAGLAAAAIQFWVKYNALSKKAKTLIGLLAIPALPLINAVGDALGLAK